VKQNRKNKTPPIPTVPGIKLFKPGSGKKDQVKTSTHKTAAGKKDEEKKNQITKTQKVDSLKRVNHY